MSLSPETPSADEEKESFIGGLPAYHPDTKTGRYAILATWLSFAIGLTMLIASIVSIRQGTDTIPLHYRGEYLGLALNVLVTLCTEAAGFVHSAALKWSLASRDQLGFNCNLRLISAGRQLRWMDWNGTFVNAVSFITLVLSYVASSMVFLPRGLDNAVLDTPPIIVNNACIVMIAPFIVLGVSIMLQCVIALLAIAAARVGTWSTCPLQTTMGLLHGSFIVHRPQRCMASVIDRHLRNAIQPPRPRQQAAWHSHPSIRKIVCFLWLMTVSYGIWGGLVWRYATYNLGTSSWSLQPNSGTRELGLYMGQALNFPSWARSFAICATVQGVLTMGLHCAELVVGIVRNEQIWRLSTSTGIKLSSNSMLENLKSFPSIGLLLAKPFLHWLFGLSLSAIVTTGIITNQSSPGFVTTSLSPVGPTFASLLSTSSAPLLMTTQPTLFRSSSPSLATVTTVPATVPSDSAGVTNGQGNRRRQVVSDEAQIPPVVVPPQADVSEEVAPLPITTISDQPLNPTPGISPLTSTSRPGAGSPFHFTTSVVTPGPSPSSTMQPFSPPTSPIHKNGVDGINTLQASLTMRPVQIIYLSAGIFLLASLMTFLSLRRPQGPLPATFGHIQTIADLVDEWHAVMFWGHKSSSINEALSPYQHAGMSDRPLPPVQWDQLYAATLAISSQSKNEG